MNEMMEFWAEIKNWLFATLKLFLFFIGSLSLIGQHSSAEQQIECKAEDYAYIQVFRNNNDEPQELNEICTVANELNTKLTNLGDNGCSELAIRQSEKNKNDYIVTVEGRMERAEWERFVRDYFFRTEIMKVTGKNHLNIQFYKNPKSIDALCRGYGQTTITSIDEPMGQDVITFTEPDYPVEANFIKRDEFNLSELSRDYDRAYESASSSAKEISIPRFGEKIIMEIQKAVGSSADGKWGPNTQAAVYNYLFNEEHYENNGWQNWQQMNNFDQGNVPLASPILLKKLSATFAKAYEQYVENEQVDTTKDDLASFNKTEPSPETTTGGTELQKNLQAPKLVNSDENAVSDLKKDINNKIAQIDALKNENETLKKEIENLKNEYNSQEQKIDDLRKNSSAQLSQLFEQPILRSIDVLGNFEGKAVKLDKKKLIVKEHFCWDPNKSINDNLGVISSKNDCITYDDENYETKSTGHTFESNRNRFTVNLQRSFSKVINSITVKINDEIPTKAIENCVIDVTVLNGDVREKRTFFPDKDQKILHIDEKDLSDLPASLRTWNDVTLSLAGNKDEKSDCALESPIKEATIEREEYSNGPIIDRDGNVFIDAAFIKLRPTSKPLTILLSSHLGAPVDNSGNLLPNAKYAFAKDQQRQKTYFKAIAAALENVVDDPELLFSDVRIAISSSDTYEEIYLRSKADDDLQATVLKHFTDPGSQEIYSRPSSFLKNLKKNSSIGTLILVGSNGVSGPEFCQRRAFSNILNEPDGFIDLNIVPFSEFGAGDDFTKSDPDLYICKNRPKQFVLLEVDKYDDGNEHYLTEMLTRHFKKLLQE